MTTEKTTAYPALFHVPNAPEGLSSFKASAITGERHSLPAVILAMSVPHTSTIQGGSIEINCCFSPLQLDKIAIFRSEALSSGCFTDCQQIYCSANEQLDHWADPNAPISIHLLHQLAHVERCEILGGRNRFVLAWLKYVPEEVLTNLKQGNPIDTDQLQYTMYVEGHTKNRSESICHHIHCVQE
ncbi:MAG: hypothetical protein P8179_23660 [Candidatus Thiodiazotropha sp.]